MNLLNSYFTKLQDKQVIVLGLGISNRPLVRILLENGCHVLGCDRTPREKLDKEILELEDLGCRLQLGDSYLENLKGDVVFRTPGMHPNNPALVKLRDQGAIVTSEMEVFFELCPCTLIAVTGSDGKTTTTTLIAEMLKAAKKKVWIGGNIGQPLLPRLPLMSREDYAVVELSSFQLMDMKRSPHIAVVTNLAPNHLDVHKDMEEYVWAKTNIFRFQNLQDVLVINHDNMITSGFSGNGITKAFSFREPLTSGICLQNGWICRDGKPVLNREDILLPGDHNVENYMAAMLAVEDIVPDSAIQKVAREFGGVEHRIELVREKDGVRFYNDSIASSPSRTMAGLRSFPEPVILIAGGYDKQIPYDSLGEAICEHVKQLYLTGATAGKIRKAVEKAALAGFQPPVMVDCTDFADAVHQAANAARPGDVVLMSPASASFDCFKNFMERGNYFKTLVKEL